MEAILSLSSGVQCVERIIMQIERQFFHRQETLQGLEIIDYLVILDIMRANMLLYKQVRVKDL